MVEELLARVGLTVFCMIPTNYRLDGESRRQGSLHHSRLRSAATGSCPRGRYLGVNTALQTAMTGCRSRPRRCLGPLRWTDESVSAMAVALTASILSKCWPARFTHNGYEQKWLWMRVGVMDGPRMSVVCLVMLL